MTAGFVRALCTRVTSRFPNRSDLRLPTAKQRPNTKPIDICPKMVNNISLIKASTPADLQAVLISLCAGSDDNLGEIINKLHALKAARTEAVIMSATLAGTKRKADAELAICAGCKSAFWPEHNLEKQCKYHTGNHSHLRVMLSAVPSSARCRIY